ncbi:hypothetical protein Aperf_G00000074322 [Anoplocephala perfoliata]
MLLMELCIVIAMTVLRAKLEKHASDSVNELINKYETDQQAATQLDSIQKQFKCCGANSVVDFHAKNMPAPPSCCSKDICADQDIFPKGCGVVLKDYFDHKMLIMSISSFVAFAVNAFAFTFALLYIPSSGHSSTILTNRIPPNDHDQTKQDNKARNTEWVASALRVCGKWSEQLSSKGKVYYYNCETYTSQWQKPVDWNLPDMTQSELHRFISDRQGGAQAVKRPYSALNQSKSRLQDNSSPKRAKTSAARNNIDRSKAEIASYPRSDHHNSHRDSPRNCDASSHVSSQRLPANSLDSHEPEAVGSLTAPSTYATNCCESVNNRDGVDATSSVQNKDHHNSIHNEKNRTESHSPRTRAVISSKLAPCPSSARSPLLNTASAGHLTCSDPQSSASRSSSPFPRNDVTHHSLQQHGACQRIFSTDTPVLNNGGSLLPDPNSRDGAPNADRHPPALDKQSVLNNIRMNILTIPVLATFFAWGFWVFCRLNSMSPHRANSLKPDQVLRNLVPVLSYVIATSNTNRTPHVNSASRSQSSVVNIISSILESHKKLADGRSASHASSPASNRTSLNGSDRAKNERTPGCPSSSDGASIISPCPRCSPSPIVTSSASDFRNHPQKRHSPDDPRNTATDQHNRRRSHSSETSAVAGGDGSESIKESSDNKLLTYIPLDTPEMLQFLDPHLSSRFQHTVADTLETEAQTLMCNFDRLHSVLYSELSGEMKKIRALLSISEAKIKIHRRRQEALQELMTLSETRKPLPRLSSPDPPV